MTVTAIIVGAGKGKRMGSQEKAFIKLAGSPLLARTVTPFENSAIVDEIILVVGANRLEETRQLMDNEGFQKVTQIISGGKERQDSVYNALKSVKKTDIILVHDAARPFIDPDLITTCVNEALGSGAVVPAIPVRDTIKRGDKLVEATIPRDNLWLTQTPQAFDFKLLQRAHEKAEREGFFGTDDASLVEFLGEPVAIVDGYENNIKITYPNDLRTAEMILNMDKL
jgi:2-C-methyl-D-erythritol 4-phosphate cytidylyltransferase